MKIVFIAIKEPHMSFGQVGLEIMAALLKEKGHEVYGLVESTFDTSDYITKDEQRKIRKISKIKPDLIGFSVITTRYPWCLKFAKYLKSQFQNTQIMFGGPHITAVPEIVIKQKCVDIICIGEGEEAILELAEDPQRKDINNFWFKENGSIIRNGLRPLITDLDNLPFADKSIWLDEVDKKDFKRYLIMITRGCPYSCVYCANSQVRALSEGLGPYVRTRSVDNVLEELVLAKELYDINWVVFMDDNLTLNKRWFIDFAEKYKEKIGLPYASNTHPLTIDEDRAKWLKRSGCSFIMLGLQSGSEKVRKIINRRETNLQVSKVAEICKRNGVNFTIDHIFGLTNPEIEYLRESALFYNEIRPIQINSFYLYYFPNTPIVKMRDFSDSELCLINEGRYQAPTIRTSRDRGVLGYRNLFMLLPLLPRGLVTKIIESDNVDKLERIPELFIWGIKIINSIRLGNTPALIANLKFLPHKLYERLRGYKGEFD